MHYVWGRLAKAIWRRLLDFPQAKQFARANLELSKAPTQVKVMMARVQLQPAQHPTNATETHTEHIRTPCSVSKRLSPRTLKYPLTC